MFDSSTAQGGRSSRCRRCRLPALVQGRWPLPLIVADACGIWQCRGSNGCWCSSLGAGGAPDTKALAPLIAVDDDGGVAGLGARLARALLADDVPDTEAAAPLVAVLVHVAESTGVRLIVRGRGVRALDVRGETLERLALGGGDGAESGSGRARAAGAVGGTRNAGWL